MHRRTPRPLALTAGFLVFALAAPAAAQAPRITPAGDPSVKADSIYRLAVKPEDYPEESTVLLLDDGVVRYEADGRGVTTYRQIVEILKPEAKKNFQEMRFSYAPGHEKFTLNWIRVVRPNGQVISDKPTHVQDSDVPAQLGDPVYSDRKVKRISLSGVEPGTIVDYSVTTEELKPFHPGDFYATWSVSTGSRVMRSRYVVDVPVSLPVRIREQNLTFKRKDERVKDRRVLTWATQNLPKLKPEMFVADSDGVFMSVYVASPTTWGDIARWYAGNATPRQTLGPLATKAVDSLLAAANAHSLADSLKAIHKWVAQDIRYVSIALGMGGYQPRMTDTVVATGYGDCKDKATLFVAAANHIGVTTFPVLLNSSGGVKRDLPTIDQFDHAIAAVKTPGGYQFVDLTSEFTPYGEIPGDEQGEFALVVHPDGTSEELTMPRDSIGRNYSEIHLTGTLSPEGIFDGWYEQRGVGTQQYGLRSAFRNPIDSTQRAKAANNVAREQFDDADGDSLTGFNGKDLSTAPAMRVHVYGAHATSHAGTAEILTLPFGSPVSLAGTAKELEERPRLFNIDAQSVFGYETSLMEFRVKLPAGWKAQLPKNVHAKSAFGSYDSEYAQDGDTLRVTRRSTGARGVFPPSSVKELADWLRAIAADDAKLIVLLKS